MEGTTQIMVVDKLFLQPADGKEIPSCAIDEPIYAGCKGNMYTCTQDALTEMNIVTPRKSETLGADQPRVDFAQCQFPDWVVPILLVIVLVQSIIILFTCIKNYRRNAIQNQPGGREEEALGMGLQELFLRRLMHNQFGWIKVASSVRARISDVILGHYKYL